jgi:hypothetical protein
MRFPGIDDACTGKDSRVPIVRSRIFIRPSRPSARKIPRGGRRLERRARGTAQTETRPVKLDGDVIGRDMDTTRG